MQHRWEAKITYIDGSSTTVEFDEFDELGAYIERGPNWNLIACVTTTLQIRGAIAD